MVFAWLYFYKPSSLVEITLAVKFAIPRPSRVCERRPSVILILSEETVYIPTRLYVRQKRMFSYSRLISFHPEVQYTSFGFLLLLLVVVVVDDDDEEETTTSFRCSSSRIKLFAYTNLLLRSGFESDCNRRTLLLLPSCEKILEIIYAMLCGACGSVRQNVKKQQTRYNLQPLTRRTRDQLLLLHYYVLLLLFENSNLLSFFCHSRVIINRRRLFRTSFVLCTFLIIISLSSSWIVSFLQTLLLWKREFRCRKLTV